MVEAAMIPVQVCYATPEKLSLLHLRVPRNATIAQAIASSGIVLRHPEIDIGTCKLGVYGKLKSPDATLQAGDRVEIYRPLIADPMEARRRRAKKHAGGK